MTKTIKRSYTFSDAKMLGMARQVANCVEEDLAKFNSYGVTNITVDDFRTLESDFMQAYDDNILLGGLMIATEEKDALAEKLRMGIRTVRTIAGNKWGENDARYQSYAFAGMNALPDEKLHRLGKRVIKLATQQLGDLAPEGLTPAFLANLETINTDFDASIDTQAEAQISRDIETQQRIAQGNGVFKEMTRLCKIGQDIFASTNSAKYKSYLIYHSPSKKKDKKKKEDPPIA